MDGRLEAALGAAFADRDVESVSSTGPSWNDGNETVRVAFADGETAYVKAALDGDGSRVAREQAVLAYANVHHDVPVPTVVAADPDADVPYLATDPVDGTNLLEQWSDAGGSERTSLARAVGRSIAGLHADRFDEHGHVVGGGADGLDLRTGSWTDVLGARVREMRRLASSDRFEHHFDEVLATVEANRNLLDSASAALLHGDPAKPNCFLRDGAVGLLDWEQAYVGDPAREFVRARMQAFEPLRGERNERVVAAFRDGYRERAGGPPDGVTERRPVYEAVRFLGVSGFFDKCVDYLDEPAEEFEDWVQAEMNRRLSRV